MKLALLIAVLTLLTTRAHAKDRRTYYDDAMMARVRDKIAKHQWAKDQVESLKSQAAWYVAKSDAELWDFVPPPEQLRAINVCIAHDCPFCGDEITRKAGHYPWKMDRDKPFKVTCPVCNRTFPENDFEPRTGSPVTWNTEGLAGKPETGEKIIDKGLGWVGPDGRRYYFVPYFIFWQRWVSDVLGGMSTLSRAYLVTGDPVYGRKCAVMLTKLASEYERFDYRKQGYHEGRFNVNGRISDYIWSTGNDTTVAMAYDAIYPVFADQELLTFLRGKGIENPRELAEQKMLTVMAKDVMSGYVAGNQGMHQRTLCTLAIVLNNDDPAKGPTTAAMRDWIMSGPGRTEDLLWNGFWREGIGSESSPSYASGWCSSFYEVAELLPKLGVDIWGDPKLKKMADVGLDMTIAGRFAPCLGDCGGLKGSGPIAQSAQLQGLAFSHYGDPRHAKALARLGAESRDLFTDYFDEEAVAKVVAERGTDLELRTRDLGGYGLAVLESGEGDHQRAAAMYYGYAGGGHGHHDRLGLQMWAYGKPMLPEDGYPFPFTRPDFWQWRSTDTVKHYCVVVDETTQTSLYAGDLNTLASTPEVQLMDASAEIAYPNMVSLYRRTSALIDTDEAGSYLLDVFRVRGGSQHDWCFHGPAFFELSMAGGALGPVQAQGTLAGENVAYGTQPPAGVRDGVALNLLTADGLLTGGEYGDLSKQGWAIFGRCVLTRKPGSAAKLQAAGIPAGRARVWMRVYDYNAGKNEVVTSVGGAEAKLTCEPSGTVGYRWVSQVVDLPRPATEMVLAAPVVGQEYVQIDSLVISREADRLQPPLLTGSTSGFHGLRNVRRMSPQGNWSATWHKADEDLWLTMTMPAGCAREVIVADASPELQPGNPDVIQYVLGRNSLPHEQATAGEGLSSKYVAVIEPHKGEAAVTGVEHLHAVAQVARPVSDAATSDRTDRTDQTDRTDRVAQGATFASDTAMQMAEPVGVIVRRKGAVDLVHSSLSPTEKCEWRGADKPLVVAAEFALLTLDDRGIRRAVVVNGTLLQYGDFALRPAPSPEGKVVAVDFEHNSITLDKSLANPDVWRDATVILGNELQRTSYTIREAKAADGKTTLHFGDTLFVVGMGEVAKADNDAKTIASDRSLTGYGRVDGGKHEGRWLYNEDKSKGFRIASIEGQTFQLDGVDGDLDRVFTDANGDGRRVYWISDIGPGDTYRLPATTYYARARS
jgi:hypothetical protein